MIHHLSFPEGASVNDGIDPELCSVVYTSFDVAVAWVRRFGEGALLAKTDIESAFRLLPVHPEMGPFSETGTGCGRVWNPVAYGVVAAASRAADELIGSSMVSGTWEAYAGAWRQWEDWRVFLNCGEGEEEMGLLLFVGHCRDLGWSFARLNKCMAGLAFGFKQRGLKDITKSFLVRQAVKGWRRQGVVADRRKPVSFELLLEVGRVLGQVCVSVAEMRLFRAAFALAFFGAFRIGELVCASKTKLGGVRFEDTNVFDDSVEIWLRRSKTDQVGKGCIIRLFRVEGCDMCPVHCVRDYLEYRDRVSGPLLIHENGDYLSRFQFVSIFRRCLQFLGRREEGFSGHSFRIGAATEAARRGLGEDVIKRIGRWESRRFRSYIRTDL
ncbi:integrase/recombinase xerD homolog [Leptodactylus fuscus]|uniref:integrase/recombinase xerD homolog n=1 Tax=Leptodactylus fuscus TaxID=238119 RepID=UPI003F4EDA19